MQLTLFVVAVDVHPWDCTTNFIYYVAHPRKKRGAHSRLHILTVLAPNVIAQHNPTELPRFNP